MKTYVGTKIIQAEPMDEETWAHSEANPHQLKTPVRAVSPSRAGYMVVYPDGYHSWSPADVFEDIYRELRHREVEMVNTNP